MPARKWNPVTVLLQVVFDGIAEVDGLRVLRVRLRVHVVASSFEPGPGVDETIHDFPEPTGLSPSAERHISPNVDDVSDERINLIVVIEAYVNDDP